jgi:hypothetical protein
VWRWRILQPLALLPDKEVEKPRPSELGGSIFCPLPSLRSGDLVFQYIVPSFALEQDHGALSRTVEVDQGVFPEMTGLDFCSPGDSVYYY